MRRCRRPVTPVAEFEIRLPTNRAEGTSERSIGERWDRLNLISGLDPIRDEAMRLGLSLVLIVDVFRPGAGRGLPEVGRDEPIVVLVRGTLESGREHQEKRIDA